MLKTFNLRHKVDISGQLTMLKPLPLLTFVCRVNWPTRHLQLSGFSNWLKIFHLSTSFTNSEKRQGKSRTERERDDQSHISPLQNQLIKHAPLGLKGYQSMKEETLKAQGSPSWLIPPQFKKFCSNPGDFSSGEGHPSLARGGMLIFIVCREKNRNS